MNTGRVGRFTPDLAAAFPTPRTVSFLERLLARMKHRSLDGLPTYLREERSLLSFNLMGPAEQDLLRDELLSTLHNRTVVVRKFLIANRELKARYGARNQTLPQCARLLGAGRVDTEERGRCAAGAGVLQDSALDLLDATPQRHGILVRSAQLSVLLSSFIGLVEVRPQSCSRCSKVARRAREGIVLAIHCLGKDPDCLKPCKCYFQGNETLIMGT